MTSGPFHRVTSSARTDVKGDLSPDSYEEEVEINYFFLPTIESIGEVTIERDAIFSTSCS